ncbi:MAG TPA: hypothetical protein VFZ75_02715 [Actinomycetota bacterium]|nr:hypothetical protein [Actinomycetota bacterium]
MATTVVPGFIPSRSGFRFPNAFPDVPLRRIGIPGVVSVPIGDASNGLCGGMAFAARDYFEHGSSPPADATPPSEGPLFDYIVDRLVDSFALPFGPARYLELMNPVLPDVETVWSRIGWAPHGRVWRMGREEWPKIRADIDSGHPSPLGLIRVKSTDPFDLKENHQVLAYGYNLEGGRVTMSLYDPNRPRSDHVTLSLDLRASGTWTATEMTPSGAPVFSFFRVRYTARTPPSED